MLSSPGLAQFLPELIVTSSLLTVLLLDLAIKKPFWLSAVALLGLLAAFIALSRQWDQTANLALLDVLDGSGRLNIFFRGILLLCAALCVLSSTEYVQRSGMTVAEFSILLLTATVGGMCLCQASDLVTLFVALECLSLSSYLLAGYAKADVRSNEAAIKYLLLGGASSAILAYGFSWLYGLSGGNIALSQIGLRLAVVPSSAGIWIALGTILVGLAFKLSAVPFHQWTPDVYEGSPTPVVAFLSVGSKAASLALTAKLLSSVFWSFHSQWSQVLQVLAILSMVGGNLSAVSQTSVKRMLAYSSISQMGYMMLGLVTASADGYASMTVYMVAYSFMNLGAFACVILIGLRTGTDQIKDYTGLAFRDPWLAGCFSLCLLSLAGIPPLSGFLTKVYLFWATWKAGWYALVYVGLITSTISIYYYLRLLKVILTRENTDMSSYVRNYVSPPLTIRSQSSLQASILFCVLVSTTLGIVINPVIIAAQQVAVTHPTLDMQPLFSLSFLS
uniref:NAD(P)H-quinone oxidoreductase subunit 2, chloroplastic n=1 Tax=Mesotaenium endlicherianum TaxID=184485 RepID=A0A024B4R6_9VIRI|nr:subunit 2 of NADH-plastoquinone oxidoreductase [Mesotaenium endlicherianum]AHZ11176.1 subunit 2 of NADH-plastoquinone oxidoreductase [Mesotaenium endlicherianum]